LSFFTGKSRGSYLENWCCWVEKRHDRFGFGGSIHEEARSQSRAKAHWIYGWLWNRWGFSDASYFLTLMKLLRSF